VYHEEPGRQALVHVGEHPVPDPIVRDALVLHPIVDIDVIQAENVVLALNFHGTITPDSPYICEGPAEPEHEWGPYKLH
jgi:hypothetical protein